MTEPTSGEPPASSLPASIELAWGLRERPTRGPKRGFTLEQVVAAGIRVAGTDGLAALSMGRVATELGASTMSLYRYVSAKDDLLALMVDAALGPPMPVGPEERDWRSGLTAWAVGVRAAYRRHPWSTRVPVTGPPLGPNNVAWLERALQSLGATSLTEQQKLSSVLLLSGFVRADAMLSSDLDAVSVDGAPPTGYGAALSALIDPLRFPALQRAIASGSLDDDDDIETEFDFGLARILDGIAALVESARA